MLNENEKIRRLEQSNYALRWENEKLREENKKLREENKMLYNQPQPDERDEIINLQKWEIEQLKESKEELQKELNAYEKLYEDESKTTDKLISIIKTFSSLF